MPTPPPMPPPGSLRAKVANAFINANVFLYRRSGGRIGGKFKGAPVLLLDHVGRKTGRARTSPVLYLEDGPNLVVVASRGGSDARPAWWLNLKANPETSVQIGAQRRTVVARQTTAEEKAVLWPRLVEMYGDYAIYQRRTDRDIPVIVLGPAPPVRRSPDSVA
jgi:F420H(2)-dependent quinone reductase